MTSVMLFDSDARRYPMCVNLRCVVNWIPETLADFVGKQWRRQRHRWAEASVTKRRAVTPEAIGPPCFTGSSGFQVGFGQEVQNPTNRQAIDGEPAGAENP
jgi:hypothetical protein